MIKYARTPEQKARIAEEILNFPGGVTVKWQKGKLLLKTYEQDKTENMWHREAAQQLKDETPEQKRGYCKLHFGAPIMCENEEYRKQYMLMIDPLPYEWKLQMMMLPINFPVTRRMLTGQKARYMEDVMNHYLGLGVNLTIPEDKENV